MDSTSSRPPPAWLAAATRQLVPVGALVVLFGTALTWSRLGAPAAVLWLGFVALSGAVLLFWEALRAATADSTEESAADEDPLSPLLERKRNALAALRDLEFEHSLGNLSEEDFTTLRERYRAEAREALEALDAALGGFKEDAQRSLDALESEPEAPAEKVAEGAEKEPPAEEKSLAEVKDPEAPAEGKTATEKPSTEVPEVVQVARPECASCATPNDADAVFCKKCGAKLGSAEVPS